MVPGLWIGSAPSARQARQLVDTGVDAVVDLRAEKDEPRAVWPDGVDVRIAELHDHGTPSPDALHDAALTVRSLMGAGRVVLVHCRAGLERAPTVACAALVLEGWSLDQAYRRVGERRPMAMPTDGQLASLRTLAARLRRI